MVDGSLIEVKILIGLENLCYWIVTLKVGKLNTHTSEITPSVIVLVLVHVEIIMRLAVVVGTRS